MTPSDRIPYRRLFPWLHLFRAIGIALSFRQLVVAAGAIGVLSLGQTLVEWVAPDVPAAVINVEPKIGPEPGPFAQLRELTTETRRPWEDILRPSVAALANGETLAGRLKSVGCLGWVIAVWSLFGLVLCRLAARRFARNEDGSLRKAILFGPTRWIHAIVAPLLPSVAALLIMVLAVLAILPSRLSWVGPTLALMASPVVLLCGLVAAYLMIAVLLGWPLMVAAIATDDCDGFGSLSRSYSLWTGRPWHFVWCWISVACAGAVAMIVANWLMQSTLQLSGLAIHLALGETPAMASAVTGAQFLAAFALKVYGISFFWTSATIVYALLRQSVDGMPLDNMAPDDDERPNRDPLPVVGMPAMR